MAADRSSGARLLAGVFRPSSRGVLRYEDRLSRLLPGCSDTELLGRHLSLAAAGALPVPMVVSSRE